MSAVRPALAASLERLGTETAFSVLARARELERPGRDVIHLEIGEPDFDTPAHVCEAAYEPCARAGRTTARARACSSSARSIAAELSATRGIEVDPANVLVGTGAKPFLFFTILAVCDPGDEVIYPDPGFPIYESAIRWIGATPVPLPLLEERDFTFDPADLAARLGAADEARDPQLARRTRPAASAGADDLAEAARLIGADGRLGALRRGLLADALRGRVRDHRQRCRACSSARSCSTGSRRPTR